MKWDKLQVRIPADLHQRFKLVAVKKKKPMNTIITQFIEKFVKEEEKNEKAPG